MNNELDNNELKIASELRKHQSNESSNYSTAQRIVNALLGAFPMPPEVTNKICTIESKPNINEALKNWLTNILTKPDQQFGYLLMPLIAKRFDEYIVQIGKSIK